MSLLLQNVQIIDKSSIAHKKQVHLLIENGKLVEIDTSRKISKANVVHDFEGAFVSKGWVDLNAHFNDPGYEYREDIMSGSMSAVKGGFTEVCLISETLPSVTSKSDVNYLIKRAPSSVNIHPIAALSEDLKGQNLTEMLDLHDAGAVAFSDGDRPIWNAELLLKALHYTHDIGVPIVQNARDINISANTHMHEGKASTLLGLRGEPSMSEELMIQRDLEILKYSGGRIHFTKVSSSKGVELIRQAKEAGLRVTCDVAIHHLLFTDEYVTDFDTNYKSLPPFRSELDRLALVEGVLDGTIDAICSNHRPLDQESKKLEFDLADPGSISLQTLYSALLGVTPEIPMDIMVERITEGPKKVMHLTSSSFEKGEVANFTLFDPHGSTILNESTNASKSDNSPFWNKELKGKVLGTVLGESVNIE